MMAGVMTHGDGVQICGGVNIPEIPLMTGEHVLPLPALGIFIAAISEGVL